MSTHDRLQIMTETDLLRRNVADMEEQIHRRNTRVVELLAQLEEAKRKIAGLEQKELGPEPPEPPEPLVRPTAPPRPVWDRWLARREEGS